MTRTLLCAATAFAVVLTSSLCLAQEPAAPPDAPSEPGEPALPEPEAPEPRELEQEGSAPGDPVDETSAEPEPAPEPEPAAPVAPEEPQAPPAAMVPPAPPTAEPEPVVEAPHSWFYRDPIRLELGQRLTVTWYGVVQVDFIHDTTRSYGDTIGQSLVARGDTYEGTVGRTQFSARSTRIGLAVDAKPLAGLTPSAVLEADFAGDQPTSEIEISERAYYDSPVFRMRHAYLTLENQVLDVLIGHTDDVFGWQNTPQSTFRHTQFRLSHTFGETAPVGLDIAAAAVRPAQRDSQIPDGQAGLRFNVNAWQGLYTRDDIPRDRPLSLGVSGVARQFDVDAFTPPPTQTSNKVVGWGVSVDAMLPIIPAKDEYDRGNKLTIAGSYVYGTGIGDLMRVDGGAEFPPLPNPARASPPPEYEANVDEGLVTFDRLGVLNTIDWQGFRVDAQYYLPPSGRVRLAGIWTQAYSRNMDELYPQGGAEIELLTHVADRVRYIEGNIFFDVTPEVRVGAACIYTTVKYLDGEEPSNIRGKASAKYFF